jgi:membrane associated rhomboid family serine protease
MLSDRPYMRAPDRSSPFDPVKWLMGIFGGLYIAQQIWERPLGHYSDPTYFSLFSLSGNAVLHAQKLWSLFSYNFLVNLADGTGGVLVLIANLLGLYFFGGAVRDLVGPKRFVALYLGFVVVAAAAWCAVYPLGVDWMLFGPSASLAGLFALYSCYHADEQMTFLAFFIIPVTVKPKIFCWIWIALDVIGFVFYEMMGHPGLLWNGHIANLAAMGTAYGFYRLAGRVDPFGQTTSGGISLPRWLHRWKKSATPAPRYKVNLGNRDDLRAEVDRILDKINSQGFGALTAEEKRLLDEARDQLSRR